MRKTTQIAERVRAATRVAHSRLEQRLDIFSKLAAPRSRTQLVERFYGFHAGAERVLAPVLTTVPGIDYPSRRRSPLIIRDLAALGASSPRTIELWTPRPVATIAEALGLLYVLEGSTLGGKVIRRRVLAEGGTMHGLSFLDPYMEGSGERWQSFLSSVRREILPNDSDAVGGFIAAAIMGFEHAERWLCGDAAPDIQTRTRSQHLRPGTDPYSGIDSAARSSSRF